MSAAEDAILASGLRTRVVKVAATAFRNGLVVFFNAGFHLLEKLFLQRGSMLHDLRQIAVLCREIFQDFRIFTEPHPEIIVNSSLPMLADDVRSFRSNREFRRIHSPPFRDSVYAA